MRILEHIPSPIVNCATTFHYAFKFRQSYLMLGIFCLFPSSSSSFHEPHLLQLGRSSRFWLCCPFSHPFSRVLCKATRDCRSSERSLHSQIIILTARAMARAMARVDSFSRIRVADPFTPKKHFFGISNCYQCLSL